MYLLPRKALREEGQTAKNLLTSVELLHIRRGHHGDAMVVHDAEVVHTQTITHCRKITTNLNQFILNPEIKLNLLNISNITGTE